MTKQEIFIELLDILRPAIEKIDGGCQYCIEGFCEEANKNLKIFGIELQYLKDTYVDSIGNINDHSKLLIQVKE